MSSLYFDCLYPETKSYIAGHHPRNYSSILSRVLRFTHDLTSEIKSKLKQDLLTILGYSDGDFGVATTHNTRLVSHNGYINLTSNDRDIYGYNTLSFEGESVNPAYLNFELDRRPHHIDYKNVVTSKITEAHIRTSEFYTTFYYCPRKNVIASSYVKKRAKHLFYFFKDERAVVRENYKTLRFKENISSEHKKSFINALLQSGVKINPEIANKLSAHSLIRYLSNPLWRDLNVVVNQDFVSQIHVKYHRLSYYYKKYGTKKLREVYFGTSVKSLQKILSKEECLIPFFNHLTEFPAFNKLDLNLKIELLNSVYYSYSTTRYASPRLLSRGLAIGINWLLVNGYSIRRLSNSLTSDSRSREVLHHITDIPLIASRVNLADTDVHMNSDSIRVIHDKVMEAGRRIRDQAYYGRKIELTEDEINYNLVTDSYKFVPVTITDELAELGNKLSICVRSYDTSAITKRCTIVGVYNPETSEPICCIEVANKNVVQAKLLRNRYASSNNELNKVILQWAKDNKLKIRTHDLNENPTSD